MSSGSVDQKNTYVFEVLTHALRKEQPRKTMLRSTGNGDDTMVTPGIQRTSRDLRLRCLQRRHIVPVYLEPRETRASTCRTSCIRDSRRGGKCDSRGDNEGSAKSPSRRNNSRS